MENHLLCTGNIFLFLLLDNDSQFLYSQAKEVPIVFKGRGVTVGVSAGILLVPVYPVSQASLEALAVLAGFWLVVSVGPFTMDNSSFGFYSSLGGWPQ